MTEAHLPWPAGKAEAEQYLHWHWGDLPVNAYIEAFLNDFFHHYFKGQTASEVMQSLSDETFTIKNNLFFNNGV